MFTTLDKTLIGIIMLIAITLIVSSCDNHKKKIYFGQPTPITSGKTPLDILVQIQNEFIAIEKPILKKYKHHKKWKITRFADSSYSYGPFDEVILTSEAYVFCQKHTLREIVTALSPLLFDPETGGEVAVLLSGLPGNKRDASFIHRARDLKEINYLSPSEKGEWDIVSMNRNGAIGRSYIGYCAPQYDAPPVPPKGTLDYEIYSILKKDSEVFNYKVREYYEPFDELFSNRTRVGKRFKKIKGDFTSIIQGIRPTKKFQNFIRSNTSLFSATVLFGNPQTDRRYTSLMWSLGLEKKYLPLSIYEQAKSKAPFNHGSFEERIWSMKIDFINEAGTTLLAEFKTISRHVSHAKTENAG